VIIRLIDGQGVYLLKKNAGPAAGPAFSVKLPGRLKLPGSYKG
jgi:hypothetical protein